jgi:hypothetical protein
MEHGPKESAKEITIGLSALFAFLSVFAAPGIGYGVWTWSNTHRLNDRVERLEEDLATLYHSTEANFSSIDATLVVVAAEANANSIHRDAHEESAERWIDQIIDNSKQIRELQRAGATSSRP